MFGRRKPEKLVEPASDGLSETASEGMGATGLTPDKLSYRGSHDLVVKVGLLEAQVAQLTSENEALRTYCAQASELQRVAMAWQAHAGALQAVLSEKERHFASMEVQSNLFRGIALAQANVDSEKLNGIMGLTRDITGQLGAHIAPATPNGASGTPSVSSPPSVPLPMPPPVPDMLPPMPGVPPAVPLMPPLPPDGTSPGAASDTLLLRT